MRHFANVLILLLFMTLRKDLQVSTEEQLSCEMACPPNQSLMPPCTCVENDMQQEDLQTPEEQLSIDTQKPVCHKSCPGGKPPVPPCNCPDDKPKKKGKETAKPKKPKKEGKAPKDQQKDLQTPEEQLSIDTQKPVCDIKCPGGKPPVPPCNCPDDQQKKESKSPVKPKKPKKGGKPPVKPKDQQKDLQTPEEQLSIDTQKHVCDIKCPGGKPPVPPCNCPDDDQQKEEKSPVKPKEPKKGGKSTAKPKKPKKMGQKTIKPKKPNTTGQETMKAKKPNIAKQETMKPKKPKKKGKSPGKPKKPKKKGKETAKPKNNEQQEETTVKPKDQQKDLQTPEEQLSIDTQKQVCDIKCEDGSDPKPPCVCPFNKTKKEGKSPEKSKKPKKTGQKPMKPKKPTNVGQETMKPKKPKKDEQSTVKPKKPKKEGKETVTQKDQQKDLQTPEEQLSIDTQKPACDIKCKDGKTPEPPCNCPDDNEEKSKAKPKKPKKTGQEKMKPKKPKKEGQSTVKPTKPKKKGQETVTQKDMQKDLQISTQEEQSSMEIEKPVCDKMCPSGTLPVQSCNCLDDESTKNGKTIAKPQQKKSFKKKRSVKRHVA